MGECVDTQVDQGVDGRHPSSHLLTPRREEGQSGKERDTKNSMSDRKEKEEERGQEKVWNYKMREAEKRDLKNEQR